MTVYSEDTKKWGDLIFDGTPIEIDYNKYDLGYKERARKELCEELGFEPDLKVSMVTEMFFRNMLKRHDLGEVSMKNIQRARITHACIIRNLILKQVPEQAHLAAQYIKEFPQ